MEAVHTLVEEERMRPVAEANTAAEARIAGRMAVAVAVLGAEVVGMAGRMAAEAEAEAVTEDHRLEWELPEQKLVRVPES